MILATLYAVLEEHGYTAEIRPRRPGHGEVFYAVRATTAHRLFPCSEMPRWGEQRFRALVAELRRREEAA